MTNKEIIDFINEEDKNAAVAKAIYNKLGVTVRLVASECRGVVVVEDHNDDVDSKMRGNKILRTLFKCVTLSADAWSTPNDNGVNLRIRVHYSHPDGGSNGHVLGILTIYDDLKVKTYFNKDNN